MYVGERGGLERDAVAVETHVDLFEKRILIHADPPALSPDGDGKVLLTNN